jgi:transcription elongation factor GreB
MLREQLQRAERAGDERNARYLKERVDSAILVERRQPAGIVEFGATVSLRDVQGRAMRLRIVGEDEADPRHGSVSWDSPIARALVDHQAGDQVTVLRPAGPIQYTIEGVEYEDAREDL